MTEYTTLSFKVSDEELAEMDEAMRRAGIGVGMSRATRSDYIRCAVHIHNMMIMEEGFE